MILDTSRMATDGNQRNRAKYNVMFNIYFLYVYMCMYVIIFNYVFTFMYVFMCAYVFTFMYALMPHVCIHV